MTKKSQATFRREWLDAIAELSQSVRYQIYQAAIIYQLTGEVPEMKSAVARAVFYFIKKEIDAAAATSTAPAVPDTDQPAQQPTPVAEKEQQPEPTAPLPASTPPAPQLNATPVANDTRRWDNTLLRDPKKFRKRLLKQALSS